VTTGQLDTSSGGGDWLSDTNAVSIHDQVLRHSGAAAAQNHTYDPAGRLVQATDVPAAGVCTTGSYRFDADSNRRIWYR
jgi:hypothetical protein